MGRRRRSVKVPKNTVSAARRVLGVNYKRIRVCSALLTAALVFFKLCGIIDASWLLIFLPMIAIAVTVFLVVVAAGLIVATHEFKNAPRSWVDVTPKDKET